jgi:isoleucyl-tRNA synthetase
VLPEQAALLSLVADEVNVKSVELIGDESELVDRRVKPLLPRIGKRLGSRIPEVMAAAREGRFEIRPDGSVELAGVVLAAADVEVQASPRAGTAVAHDQGLVVVIDTLLSPELIAEGDARELVRAVQDLRRDAGLALDDQIELWLDGVPEAVRGYLPTIGREVLATVVTEASIPSGATASEVELGAGRVRVGLLRVAADARRGALHAAAGAD